MSSPYRERGEVDRPEMGIYFGLVEGCDAFLFAATDVESGAVTMRIFSETMPTTVSRVEFTCMLSARAPSYKEARKSLHLLMLSAFTGE